MSALKVGVPAPHAPLGSKRGLAGGKEPERGDCVRAMLLGWRTLCVHLLTGI